MKKWLYCLTSLFSILGLSLLSADNAQEEKKATVLSEIEETSKNLDTTVVSKALGHLISKNLTSLDAGFDLKFVVDGLKDALDGKEAPLSEEATIEAISKLQELSFTKKAIQNLKEAQDFMTENMKNEGVVEIEVGKLQYTTTLLGSGAKVEPHCNPMVKYQGRFLNGQVFGESLEGETISLDDTFPGLSKGLVGMQEGEKRTLYIHPDLAYGSSGIFPPNSLLTFDVEVLKADVPAEKDASLASKVIDTTELEKALENKEAVR